MGEARSPVSYRAFAHIPKATPLLEVLKASAFNSFQDSLKFSQFLHKIFRFKAAWTGDAQLVKLLLEAKADLKANAARPFWKAAY